MSTPSSNQPPAESGLIAEFWSWARVLSGAFLAYTALTTAAVAQYSIPSESMAPSLEVGDRVLVSKFAYGYSRYSLPFGLSHFAPAGADRLFERLPARGDVVVFMHPQEDKVMIKRLIGLPGDVIEVRGGALYINGEAAALSEPTPLVRDAFEHGRETAIAFDETLPQGVTYPIHHFPVANALSEFGPYQVPEGYFFAMGDNRDNSLDSRWIGMGPAPLENLIGRAETVIFAPRGCQAEGAPCRDRWMSPLHN
jgi:signal peptidase I